MNGRTIVGVLLGIVAVLVLAGIGVAVYDAGMAQGIAQAAQVSGAQSVPAPYPYYGPYGYGPFLHPWGFGFGFLGFLFPLFFIFLIFGLLRWVFWGPRRGWGGYRGERGRAMLEDWHRRQHELPAEPPSSETRA
jgi:hypothetical protein